MSMIPPVYFNLSARLISFEARAITQSGQIVRVCSISLRTASPLAKAQEDDSAPIDGPTVCNQARLCSRLHSYLFSKLSRASCLVGGSGRF
ncbi:hypothetical protein PENANT_c003G07763 [Penicillium antarcticum]|uniref:Uncharacterized protein n=1 Tax=Penicillium antarcticum TaxID=416450 RepID=A0A1V6QHT1_9EURO|nr:hypothetical protein PENANT_c003G07763 [Penicillium antarcticum]